LIIYREAVEFLRKARAKPCLLELCRAEQKSRKYFFCKMALYSELPVYKATYDLLMAVFRFTKDFGKEYKDKVGESLKKETIQINQRNANSNCKKLAVQ
jgi:hypothetical protein